MLLLALMLGLTTLIVLGVTAPAPRRLTIGSGPLATQTLFVRRGRPVLIVNGDIRPHRLMQLAGPDIGFEDLRLDRAGAACTVHFDERGTYTLRSYAGPSLVPWLEDDAPREHALVRVVVR